MNWYAVYTNPRTEKKAHTELIRKGIDAYLPLQRTLKQWSDRKKWVEEPLFRSYIFVNITQSQYFDVLDTHGVVRYITFEGKAVPIPPKQIDAIRYYLEEIDADFPLSSDRGDWLPGTAVEITRGPLKGLTGHLVNFQSRQKVRIEIEALGQFLHLNISSKDLKSLE
jgi:transcriptional antiterminator RfaH